MPTILFSIVRTILSVLGLAFLGSRRRTRSARNGDSKTSSSSHSTYTHSERHSSSPKEHKKMFARDEGEYVDFEEIKDEK